MKLLNGSAGGMNIFQMRLSRGEFFALWFVLFIMLVGLVAHFGGESWGLGALVLAIAVNCLILMPARLRDAGNSHWWTLLIFVPLANILLVLHCWLAPTKAVRTA